MVLFLCSDRASYISGGCYNVDGGYSRYECITNGKRLRTLTAERNCLIWRWMGRMLRRY